MPNLKRFAGMACTLFCGFCFCTTAPAVGLPGLTKPHHPRASHILQIKKVLETPDVSSQEEAQFRAELDNAIAPLTRRKLSAADAKALKAAFKALRKKNYVDAWALSSTLRDPVAKKLVAWERLRRGQGDVAEYRYFLNDNPEWPNRWRLIDHLEAKLFDLNDAKQTLAYFKENKPKKFMGYAALAAAHLASGNNTEAQRLAVYAWRELIVPVPQEKPFLKRLGSLLSPKDHKWRLDRLLVADIRWTKARRKRANIIRRQIKRLPASQRKKATARLSVFLRQKAASKLMSGVPAQKTPDWGLVFQKVELLRRQKKTTAATKLLLGAPTAKENTVNPDAWWGERRRIAYAALKSGNAKLAYKLIADCGPLTVNPLKAQHFMAGWLAFRYLKDIPAATKHFEAMVAAADGPLSRAKSSFWLGRAYEAGGYKAKADESYRRAAKQIDTFHGQLAHLKLHPNARTITIIPPTRPTAEQTKAFIGSDAGLAAVYAVATKLGRSVSRPFLANLANLKQTEGEVALVAHLSQLLGDTQQALRIGKRAIGRGFNLIYYSYPLHAFPDYTPLRDPPEMAFVLGVARQESEFNSSIVSGAGARGILQVMPITARHVCRDYKIKCSIPRLLTDDAYNARISSAYIADRMSEFGGSYVLGLAGYNAGPGRARQWIRQFGDPRSKNVDPLDWIERMPFKETRNYVAKVLSNIQIYRARLGQGKAALRLDQDLVRARR